MRVTVLLGGLWNLANAVMHTLIGVISRVDRIKPSHEVP